MAISAENARSIVAWSKTDNERLRTGDLTEGQFWANVHGRDALLASLPAEDRAAVNSLSHDDV
ncbi:hypothetical protein JNUCC0626_50010 (plasmid) [Lentzea sp. JNUCC 0626]|uniref:hypothetical protein n=1 Tax=Lentzea sp. JNUCC 0626 TaxID=3367513 RepID=UPI0037482142